MAEWTDVRIGDELRAILRREVDALPLVVTPRDVLARRSARRRTGRRPWMALLAAALLVVPLSLAATIAVLAPAEASPYLAVLARGLVSLNPTDRQGSVTDLRLVLVHPDGHEEIALRIPASAVDGWKSTRGYALSASGRWLALPLYPASANEHVPVTSALGIVDLGHPDRTSLVTGGQLDPVWAADDSLWWSVGGAIRRIDPATGEVIPETDPASAPRPPAVARATDREPEVWEVVSTSWAADGGTWTLQRRDPNEDRSYRLLHLDPGGVEHRGPVFEGPGWYGMPSDALVMAPDDSLAAIRSPTPKHVNGLMSSGYTDILDLGSAQVSSHTGWLVGFVRADAAATWARTEGGSR